METKPIADTKRIRIIDAIRGISILGILLMNVYVGGQYWDEILFQELISNYLSADFISTIFVQGLFEGKMRALFCMLFGAGILLFLKNKEQQNTKGLWKLHFKRMFWLLLFGLFNGYVLLFKYDILFMYAVAGTILYFFRNMPVRYKLWAMPLVILIGFVNSNLEYRMDRKEYLKSKNEETTQIDSNFKDTTYLQELKQEQALMKGNYVDVANAVYPKVFEGQTKEFISRITDNIPLMLLGMALFQLGFFSNKWSKRQYTKTVFWGYFIGIPLMCYDWYILLEVHGQDEARHMMYKNQTITFTFLIYHIQRIALALGHVAVICLIYQKGWLKPLFRRLEAIGQMALTNYLLQSLFLALIFYGFGLDFYNVLSYYQLYFVVIIIWFLQLWYSPIILKHYRFGPFEWLWRSLTYWKLQSNKRHSIKM
ncbi:DUF418 domain-containing protein [Flagellimonas crocea]|uniref:DUF418 domain-containing protein n=1 Tax=Flagellimonas crocea TaxID=3067311 RepID=UPI00296F21E5|nr:DUF418 domain-containing protein [Muricauda sp. DH64]